MILIILNSFLIIGQNMETAKLTKIDWERTDKHNSGHTKDEWGLIQDEKPP